jgi:para-nitrobenzyl esterase
LLGTAAQQFSTDSTFRCGSVEVAQRAAAAEVPVWQYQFEHFVPGREAQGAAHSFEVPYMFGNLSNTGFSAADYGPADRHLSDLMVDYWTNFAKRGDPNGPGLPVWPRYTTGAKDYLRLSSAFPANAQADAYLRGEICRLFPSNPATKQ